MLKETEKLIIFYYAAVNVITFAAFGADKYFAEKHLWRVPEAMLIFFSAMGGGAGAAFAMALFRHKTKKPKFIVIVPLCVLAHVGAWLYILEKF